MKKEKEQYKKLIRSIIVILLVACETIIFMHYWINIYNKYTVFPFFQKGHWMMAAMYIIYQIIFFVYIWRSKSGIFKKSQYYFFTGSCNVRLKCDYLFADSVTFGTIC